MTEKSKKPYFTETYLREISLNPYSKRRINSRNDLNNIIFCKKIPNIYFTTFNGEVYVMDDDNSFNYVCPSLEGCKFDVLSSYKKAAAFINGKLFVIDYLK